MRNAAGPARRHLGPGPAQRLVGRALAPLTHGEVPLDGHRRVHQVPHLVRSAETAAGADDEEALDPLGDQRGRRGGRRHLADAAHRGEHARAVLEPCLVQGPSRDPRRARGPGAQRPELRGERRQHAGRGRGGGVVVRRRRVPHGWIDPARGGRAIVPDGPTPVPPRRVSLFGRLVPRSPLHAHRRHRLHRLHRPVRRPPAPRGRPPRPRVRARGSGRGPHLTGPPEPREPGAARRRPRRLRFRRGVPEGRRLPRPPGERARPPRGRGAPGGERLRHREPRRGGRAERAGALPVRQRRVGRDRRAGLQLLPRLEARPGEDRARVEPALDVVPPDARVRPRRLPPHRAAACASAAPRRARTGSTTRGSRC